MGGRGAKEMDAWLFFQLERSAQLLLLCRFVDERRRLLAYLLAWLEQEQKLELAGAGWLV